MAKRAPTPIVKKEPTKPDGRRNNGGHPTGGGRPKRAPVTDIVAAQLRRDMQNGLEASPLEVILMIMHEACAIDADSGKMVDKLLALEAAKIAAPYMHSKLATIEHKGAGGGPITISVVTGIDRAPSVD